MVGKFGSSQAEYLYELSLDGCGVVSGDVESPTGWFGLFDVDGGGVLPGAWLLFEDSQGFVDAEYFGSVTEAQRVFDGLDAEYGAWLGCGDCDCADPCALTLAFECDCDCHDD